MKFVYEVQSGKLSTQINPSNLQLERWETQV